MRRLPIDTSGVRPYPNGNSGSNLEVFDRRTGAAVASGRRRAEAEREARKRNHDASGPAEMTLCLGRPQITALQEALETYMAFRVAGQDHQILEDLYVLFASRQDGR